MNVSGLDLIFSEYLTTPREAGSPTKLFVRSEDLLFMSYSLVLMRFHFVKKLELFGT